MVNNSSNISKQTTTSHLKSFNTKEGPQHIYGVGNPGTILYKYRSQDSQLRYK